MMKLPVLLIILIGKCLGKNTTGKEKPSKISPYQMPNGEIADNADIPFLAGIFSNPTIVNRVPQCSGLLIKGMNYEHEEGFVATSIFCLENNQVSNTFAVAVVGGVLCRVLNIFVMKNIPDMIDTDVAVLQIYGCKLDTSRAIPLVEMGKSPYKSEANVSGWNTIAGYPELKVLDSEYILTKKECAQSFKGSSVVIEKESTFCFGEEENGDNYRCEGHGGSPVLSHGKNPYALGIASWTFESSDEKTYPCVAVDFSNEDVHKFLSHFINKNFSTLLGFPTLGNGLVVGKSNLLNFPFYNVN